MHKRKVWSGLGTLGALALPVMLLLASPGPVRAGHVGEEVRQSLATPGEAASVDALDTALLEFYAGRGYEPLWFDGHGANGRAAIFAEVLLRADDEGLEPADYEAERIAALVAADGGDNPAALEVMLSRALALYAGDASAGRTIPSEVDSEMFLEPARADPGTVLTAAAAARDLTSLLAGLVPDTPQYRRLRTALADYRALAAAGGWAIIDAGETLKPGMSDPRTTSLRERLSVSGDWPLGEPDYWWPEVAEGVPLAGAAIAEALAAGQPAPAGEAFYDDALAQALRNFQFRHGLDPDGAVGEQTLAALNLPVEARIDQILLNLERRRWLPEDLGERHVFVNMADFEAKVVDGDHTVFVTHVVVGTPYHRTPVFSELMRYVEMNPYWNVTANIARNELLPRIQEDPGYLAARNYTLFASWDRGAAAVDPWSVDWSQVTRENFPYRIRQEPGDGNALGQIKFMFPNPHNIYMHDTPSRNLFSRTVRSFSHGCIRTQNPLDLAELILGWQEGWDRARIDATVASGERTVVSLEEPLPVHLTYLTAWANKDGTVHFRSDIYGRDALLAVALLPSRSDGN